ncbi:exopolyphosphatase, partial [Pseudidiomarina aestuarii]
ISGLDEERAPIIAGGLAILIGLMEELNIEQLEAHDAALREGVLYELAEQVLYHDDVRQRTIESIAIRYSIDREQATRVQQTVLDLYEQVAVEWGLLDPEWRLLLSWAALLHEVGLHINFSSRQRHAGYILQHTDMPGFNKEQQKLLAALVRHFRKKVFIEDIPPLQLYHQFDVVRVLALLRLAVLFNTDRQTSQLLLKTQASKDVLLLTLTPQGRANPTLLADLASEAYHQLRLGITLRFE